MTWTKPARVVPTRLLALMLAGAIGSTALAQDELKGKDAITGTMTIDFKTRTTPDSSGELAEGSAAIGAQDKYTFDLTVAETVNFSGTIVRQPNLYSKMIRKIKQGAALGFNVGLSVVNPKDMKQKKSVGKWVGNVPINTDTGAYELAGAKAPDRPLRIAIDSVGQQKAFEDMFAGRLVGKAEKKENLASYTYKRVIGEKTVEIVVKKSDPMRFDNVELAKGPSDNYPRTIVNGRLDYDYETGNWFTDGLRLKYNLNGKDMEDVLTGSIKWVPDANHDTNGKGYYDFNLRFNEDKNKSTKGESAAFEKMSSEDAFFVVDDSVPCLTGRIEYEDTMISGKDQPSMSKVTYKLEANKLNKQQVTAFAKLWLLAVGPTNDE